MGRGKVKFRPKGKKFFKNPKNKKQKKGEKEQPKNYFQKNYKHFQRSKEAEELLKRQQEAEAKYRQKNQYDEESVTESEHEDEEEKVDHFEELLSSLNTKRGEKRKAAIESSDEEEVQESVDGESNDEKESEDEELNDEQTSEGEQSNEEQEFKDQDSNEEDSEVEESNDDQESDVEESDNDEHECDVEESDNDDQEDIEKTNEDQKSKDVSIEQDEEIQEDDNQEEFDSEMEDEEKGHNGKSDTDPYDIHLAHEISSNLLESVSATPQNTNKHLKSWPILGQLQFDIPKDEEKSNSKQSKVKLIDDYEATATEGKVPEIEKDHLKISIKPKLEQNIESLSEFQLELLSIFNNYQDLYYPQRTFDNAEELRTMYCLHALNHVLKSRTRVLHHNAKLGEQMRKKKKKKQDVFISDHFKDQGLVRPKVLIIVPFRDSVLKIIDIFKQLLAPNDPNGIMNYKRFHDEFTGEELYFPKQNPKPEDYEQTFAGNIDDGFRIGMSFTKKSIKLYTQYYASDIIIASPLGLRMTIGAEGEAERDYDFLASIELMILDQADIFMAQNWDHFLHVMDHLHLQPKSTENTDFSRVRSWCINGWSKFYRQSLMFTSIDLPEFRSLFNNRFLNYRGKVRTTNPVKVGSIRHVTLQVSQVFHRIDVKSVQSSFDTRFQHFINIILPQLKTISMAHCLIFIPSYFDYVRLRNYFKKEELSFVQVCEYSQDGKIARARDMFFHGSAHFMLYSERSHFFKRPRIKGIRHLVFYQPPTWPHFYSEMINLMQDAYQNKKDGIDESSMTVTCLYTKYDMLRISAIVGSERTSKMAQSYKSTHMFTTD